MVNVQLAEGKGWQYNAPTTFRSISMAGATQSVRPEPREPSASDRLDSWKEIAAYLKKSVRTVHRWEPEKGLPVRRHLHQSSGTVYAFKSELDTWRASRNIELDTASDPQDGSLAAATTSQPRPARVLRWWLIAVGAVVVVAALALVGAHYRHCQMLRLSNWTQSARNYS
jgi:hypothetical protein